MPRVEAVDERADPREAAGLAAARSGAKEGIGLDRRHFRQVAVRGFGDPQNSYSFSMAWFQEHLYVGTVRNILALVSASPPKHAAAMNPWPVRVPKTVFSTDLRSQIWRYEPGKGLWEQVFVSPLVPGPDGEPVPRDIGYRCMAVARTASDPGPALYVSTASSNTRGPGAHVLRLTQTDGVMAASPPGLGDQNVSTFRTLVAFRDRLYTAPTGSGRAWNAADRSCVYESTDPVSGIWRAVSEPNFGDPTNDTLYAMAEFNDHLYVGTLNPVCGYQIWKTCAEGTPPYRWSRVITLGAYRGSLNQAAMTMRVFKGALYVGSGISNGGYDRTYKVGPGAGEVIRIFPDDSWEIVAGRARKTPVGQKRPLSDMGPGFDNPFAGYIWSMAVHDGWLYVGTFDSAVLALWADPRRQSDEQRMLLRVLSPERFLEQKAGFDLWRSRDGVYWVPVSQNGFGNPFNYGIRTLMSTPAGLFVGTANPFGPEVALRIKTGWEYVANPRGGTEVWLGSAETDVRSEPIPEDARDIILVRDAGGGMETNPEIPEPPLDLSSVPAELDREQLLAERAAVELDWRAAARRATEASFAYHYVRVLGALARRTMVSETSQKEVPAWAVAIRQWEGALGDGAARRAGLEAIRASRNFHLVSARRELILWALSDTEKEREAKRKKYLGHLKSIERATKRLKKANAPRANGTGGAR